MYSGFTKEIREGGLGGKDFPIIALTAHAEKEYLQRCLAAGMNDTLVKPISKESLREVLLKWLNIES